jgi:hypothetical protein
MSAAAVIIIWQKRYMRRFREASATDSSRAVTLKEAGCHDSWIFRRLVTRGVFVPGPGGRFYLDEHAALAFRQWQMRVALIFTVVALLAFLVFLLFHSLFS